MNASPKLQIAATLTFSAQSINSSDFISSFLTFYLICTFLTHIPIFIFSLLHATRFLILLFTQFPSVSISSLFSLHRVYFSSLSFFLSVLFLRAHLHFFVYILPFPLLLFLYVHYFFLFVCCVRYTLVTVQFTSVLFKPLKGIQWLWYVTAPSSEEHDVCSIYSYSAVGFQGASIELLAF